MTHRSPEHAVKPFSQMAGMVATFDWSKTELDPMDRWPQSLQTAVGICLNSQFPMFVWWGPQLINIYNDAYAPVLGKRHPSSLGMPAREIWTELWPAIGDDVAAVVERGEAVSRVRERLVMERNGYPEETFFTYSHSPIPNDVGGIGGLFQVCFDETATVRAERALAKHAEEGKLAPMTIEQQSALFSTVLTHSNDFAYLFDREGRFLYANRPLLTLWNLPLVAVMGKTFYDLPYTAELANKLHSQVMQVVNTRSQVIDETEYSGPTGITGSFEYIFSPIPGPDGEVEVVSGSTREITRRKHAELEREQSLQALEAERRNLAAIVAEAPAFIAV